jgi:hypothetical protein
MDEKKWIELSEQMEKCKKSKLQGDDVWFFALIEEAILDLHKRVKRIEKP